MCAAGDYDLMQPLFNMYAKDIFEICKSRTNKYFGFDGAYYPECMYFWGSVFTATYGWTPYEEREDKLQESGWHKWEWVAGPELVFMMLDYYDYTLDEQFLMETVLPVAQAVVAFFDNYYQTNENGKFNMFPSMACETWWDCTNPMPEIAGLHAVTQRILNLPESLVSAEDRSYWMEIGKKIPDFPLRETPDGMALAPAERFADKRNIENPELYAVFPFRHFGIGNSDLDWGINALTHRWDKGAYGWRQDDLFMSYLGLAEQAKRNLVERSKNHHKDSRFPAFWGPNYDWIPDQDHGGVLMRTLQSMLVQADPYSKKIYLLPAWPEGWNAEFKLRAPYNTVIQATVEDGTIKDLQVTPASRKEDVIIVSEQPQDDQMLTIAVTTGGHDFEQEPFFTMFNNLPGIRYDHIRLPDEADKLKPGFEKKYDVLVRYDMVEAFTEEQQASYKKLLQQGIGVVALHHNLGAHRNWKEYADLIGGKYVFENTMLDGKEHTPSDYQHDVDIPVSIVDRQHPVTMGISDFTIHDETYKNYYVSPQSQILLTTDSPDSDPELAWVTKYEQSRVVYLLLGHDSKAWKNPVYPKLLLNAIKWVANK
jgi:type 1 glutamine amidotransferase